jgi:phosphatidylinositol alpha-1,6-mannosyltransferase
VRVLIVATEFPPGPGGIGTHAHELARHLARRYWSVTVLASQDYVAPEEAAAFNAAQPFRVVTWKRTPGAGPLRALGRLTSLAALLRESPPDVAVASGSRAVLACAGACRRSRTPFVAVGHGTEFGSRGLVAAALRAAFRRAAAVVAVSEYTRRLYREFCADAPAAEVIPNGADPERFRPMEPDEIRRALGGAIPEGRLLVTVGNVTPRKAQDVVVRALPRILASVPDARYALAGLPTDGERILRIARECGVADRVHLLGRLAPDALCAALNAAEVFVLTSRRTASGDVEGYGIAAVEAALCGRPAVVSRGSGLEEAIVDGETGLAVSPDDPAATAEAVIALMTDAPRRARMGQRARDRALAEQTWDGRISRYAEVLERARRAAPARESAAPAAAP